MRIARRLAFLLLAVGSLVAALGVPTFAKATADKTVGKQASKPQAPSPRPQALKPQAPSPEPEASDPAMPMVRVLEGEFWMGRTKLWLMDEIGWQVRDRSDDRPVHRVNLPAFSIDTHEVTNAAYAALVAAKGAQPPWHWGGRVPPAGKERLPVYNVSWHEAAKYCEFQGKRLPTEAEWEKAARGGADGLDYSWGDDYAGTPEGEGGRPLKRAHSNSATGPLPVGSLAPNQYGLYDMSGNVWEWVADWYDLYYYSVSPEENPKGPERALYKVIRGGGWADSESRYGTVYFRNFTLPETQQPTVGFRCARN